MKDFVTVKYHRKTSHSLLSMLPYLSGTTMMVTWRMKAQQRWRALHSKGLEWRMAALSGSFSFF